MPVLTQNPQRVRVVADAVVSSYINELAQPRAPRPAPVVERRPRPAVVAQSRARDECARRLVPATAAV